MNPMLTPVPDALPASIPQTPEAVCQTVLSSGASRFADLPTLRDFLTRWPQHETLRFLLAQARAAPDHLRGLTLLDAPGEQVLTQRQCLAVLASAFFCTFTARPSFNCMSTAALPSINLDELFGPARVPQTHHARLRMLMAYFDRCRRRIESGDALDRPIRFQRLRSPPAFIDDWRGCTAPLLPLTVAPMFTSIDDAHDALRVDFANRCIGGAAIAYGCVQEEIMFCCAPELLVTRLLCPLMAGDEAIAIFGAERFAAAAGYAFSLEFAGDVVDPAPQHSAITAIDALDLRLGGHQAQYGPISILRELNKARAGFDIPEAPAVIATGNWGCGAFGGDPALKSILQWIAASRVGKTLRYFPWDQAALAEQLPRLSEALAGRPIGAVLGVLLDGEGPIHDRLHRRG